ncbi:MULTISPECIES: DUF6233 domain-containing protein [Streptomyces]|uniref:DUF6233 domain-containing protein n=1 Tax=Streptomyces flaveolus TaxID=67297 RepID=A0ABV3AKG1_9ACTN|nr:MULTISPECIES: DUF6233 domain-containing protein [Streptomyces]
MEARRRICVPGKQSPTRPLEHRGGTAGGGAAPGERVRPSPAAWLSLYGLDRDDVDAVHVGDCRAARKSGRCRPATRGQALDALRSQVPPRVHCRRDKALGIVP